MFLIVKRFESPKVLYKFPVLILLIIINPFTAPACKISGLKDARTRLQTVDFRSNNATTFNATRFDGNPVTSQCEKKAKRLGVSNFALLMAVFK